MFIMPYDPEIYTPTKPVAQIHRAPVYSVLFGIAIAAGLFTDRPLLFVGLVLCIRGLDILIFRLRHGWRWRLADKYLIAVGAVIVWASYHEYRVTFFSGRRWLDELLLMVFLATLGVIMPLLTSAEMLLLWLRCSKTVQAEVADVITTMFLDLPGAGISSARKCCPVFRLEDGQIICDEWFTETPFTAGSVVPIKVAFLRNTEIFDRERVRSALKKSWRNWLIYEAFAVVFTIAVLNV